MNLSILLQGYEGQEFWSPIWGNVLLKEIDLSNNCRSQPLLRVIIENVRIPRNLTATGKLDYSVEKTGRCILWPNVEAYEMYPLDPEKAWELWENSDKTYDWRARVGDQYFFINFRGTVDSTTEHYDDHNNLHYKTRNYFKSPEKAWEVAQSIKKIIEEAHKKEE